MQEKVLMDIIDVYRGDIQINSSFVVTGGYACHEVVTLNDEGCKTIIMDNNNLMIYDSGSKEFQCLYTSEKSEEDKDKPELD